MEMADNETDVNDWTVMFFFAGDNSLSPLIVSQLKAIKDAGFGRNVDVLAHFDSNEAGVPTRIFNVNRQRKRFRPFALGDEGSALVRDMRDDNITPDEMDEIDAKLGAALRKPDSTTAQQALENFLTFCAKKFKARNYILFLIGHGLIVGHDSFLPDDHPASALTLKDLHDTLCRFNSGIKGHEGTLQLLALHSCSMSAIEVAYELRSTDEYKTAEYMMGSEGISYIGSWPYRQMLIKLLCTVKDVQEKGEEKGEEKGRDNTAGQYEKEKTEAAMVAAAAGTGDMRPLIEGLYDSALSNATDFALSGYSLDLTLCSLDDRKSESLTKDTKFESLTKAIQLLVSLMRSALEDKRAIGRVIKELILLAHWESQSYWNESYTDLFDFCQCLGKRCTLLLGMLNGLEDEGGDTTDGNGDKTRAIRDDLEVLATACQKVMDGLDVNRSDDIDERFKQIVVRTNHVGPQYQYSHGLSIFFPWSQPLDDDPLPRATLPRQTRQSQAIKEEPAQKVMERYAKYEFNKVLGKEVSWGAFLDSYFKNTMRDTRKKEDEDAGIENEVLIDSATFNHFGTFAGNPMAALTKGSPSTGADCTCASIKNYPTKEEVTSDGKTRRFSAF
jgi:hypothetical protein